jgi:hypothetical protein
MICTKHRSEAMTPTEQILLQEMRYIASISTGQVKRVAEVALSTVSAMNAALVTKPDSRPKNCGTNHCSCIVCPYVKPTTGSN